MEKIRSPIIVTVGHVDHGKTTLLDKIRGTLVTDLEPGKLSQHIGASYIPDTTIRKICGNLLEKFKVKLVIPGLLLLDTPGHASFITLRKRGGAVSDLAILVIDLNEGFQEQTDESLLVLKQFKVPFVVAATKIDRIPGWHANKGESFLESFKKQSEGVKDELDKKLYQLVSQLAERNFNSERFDRIDDFTKQIAIIPCSGITGEGIPELLMMLAGLSQQFLKDKLKISETARGTVLEVKEVRGFGLTLDVILYDGQINKSDYLIIGGKQPVVTKAKALLIPKPLRELRVEKQFDSIDKVTAASGIKISAPNLENVIPGSPIIAVSSEKEIEEAKKQVQKEVEEVQFKKQIEGVVLKADTLGSLEAMIKILNDENVPIRKAEVGNVSKQDIVELQNVKEDVLRTVLAFNVKVLPEAENVSKDLKVKVFQNNIIYRLIDEFKEWKLQKKERELQELMEKTSRPFKVKILKGFVFRVSNPAVFGVEVLKGSLRPGILVKRTDGKIIGKIKEIQKEGKPIKEAKVGDKIAVSMEEPTFGRQIKEGDVLISIISQEDRKILSKISDKITEGERELLKEI